jgi:tripartite-type tricarboxylate transporter receptor subunit TctC
MMFATPIEVMQHVQSGKLRVLAVTSKERYAPLANTPSVSETLLPGFDVRAWYALAAPKKLAPAVVSRLNEAAHAALNRRDFSDKLLAMGFQPWPTSAREAQDILGSEVARWTKVIRDEKIQSAN